LLGDLQQEVKKRRRKIARVRNWRRSKVLSDRAATSDGSSLRIFAEIVEHLNIVEPDIKARYPLNPLVESGVTLNNPSTNSA
jgi:hypothetical protein